MNSQAAPFFPRQIPKSEIVFPEEAVVRHHLDKLEVEIKGSLPEVVCKLTNEVLAKTFSSLWKGPKKKFTEHYRLDFGVFSNFVACKNLDDSSRKAIIDFLTHKFPASSEQKELPPFIEDQRDIELRRVVSDSVVHSIKQLVEKIGCETIDTVCFVDGDNCPWILDELATVPHIFTICYLLQDSSPKNILAFSDSGRFAIRYTKSRTKQASDILMSTDAVFLSTSIPLNYFFVSSDLFIEELVGITRQEYSVSSFSADPKYRTLSLALSMIKRKEKLTDMAQTMGLINVSRTLEREFGQFTFDQILTELVHILECDATQLPTDVPLRLQWKLTWRGQMKQFCSKYGVLPRDFSRYIRGSIEFPECENAVKMFLSKK